MSKTATLIAATLALSTIALTSANAGPAAGMSTLKQSLAPAATQSQIVHKTGKKGKFYAGLAIGLGTAALIHHGYHSHRGRRWRQCRRWRRWCWRGSDRACWKYHTRCY